MLLMIKIYQYLKTMNQKCILKKLYSCIIVKTIGHL